MIECLKSGEYEVKDHSSVSNNRLESMIADFVTNNLAWLDKAGD